MDGWMDAWINVMLFPMFYIQFRFSSSSMSSSSSVSFFSDALTVLHMFSAFGSRKARPQKPLDHMIPPTLPLSMFFDSKILLSPCGEYMMLLLCSQQMVLMPNADQNRVPTPKLQSLEARERCCYFATLFLLCRFE